MSGGKSVLRLDVGRRGGRRAPTLLGVRLLIGVSLLTGLAAVGVAVGPSQVAGAVGGQCNANPTLTASPDAAYDNLFQSYGNTGLGYTWTGGDGTESVALPNGTELWLFDDTFLGTVTNGQRIWAKTPYIHNSLIVDSQGALTKTYFTNRTHRPTAYVNPVIRHPYVYAFWPGGSVVNGNTLQVLGRKMKFKRDGTYTGDGEYLATFALPSLKRLELAALPWTGIDWSAGIMSDGGYTYLYGSSGAAIFTARVVGTDLTSPWAYFDGTGWTPDSAAAVPVESLPTLSHFSVSDVGGTYILVARSTVESDEIVGAVGCSPVGPFGPQVNIYNTPEPTQYPASDGVMTYGAHAHPELSPSPNTLLVSYDVNPIAPQGLKNPDSSIYRPRFITVTVG